MSGPAYNLRGRFASRRTFIVPQELTLREEPVAAPVQELPRWYSAGAFTLIGTILIFFMCSLGPAGA